MDDKPNMPAWYRLSGKSREAIRRHREAMERQDRRFKWLFGLGLIVGLTVAGLVIAVLIKLLARL